MNLEFESMDVTNFRSFLGGHKFVFNKGSGLHFVRGRNELEPSLTANDVGKTTLFDCLTWILYGRTTRGLRNPNLVPWESRGKTPEGVLTLQVDEKLRRIARIAETNGIKLDGKGADQTEIDKLLQLNYETFLHTILLGQGKPLFFDLQPREKMNLFSEVLNLDRWEQRANRASDKVKSLQTKADSLSGQMEGLKRLVSEARETLTRIKAKAETWSEENQDKIDKYQGALKLAKKDLARVQRIKEETTLKYESASVEAKALRPELEKLLTQIDDNRDDLQKLENQARDKKSEQSYVIKTIASLDEGGACPTCKQPIKGTSVEKHVQEHRKQLQLLKDEEEIIRKKIMPFDTKDIELVKLREKQKAKLQEFEGLAEKLEPVLRVAATDFAHYEVICRSLTRDIQTEQEAENPYREQLSSIRTNLSKAKVELKTLEEDHGALLGQIERTKFWTKGFKDVRLFVIEEVLHELELATNVMLPEVGLHEWEVRYEVERETKSGTLSRGLNVTILSPKNKQYTPWESWGGGVGQRLRIVSALALSEVLLNYAGINPNLEILDEPTAHLAAAGVRDLCDFLTNRAQTLGRSIHFIDHRAIDSAQFSSVTTIIKDKSGSRIEV